MTFKTLGLGDNVADHYLHTNTIYPGGCSFNFAAYSSMLGNESAYLGIVNNDFAARHIIATADEMGIDTSRCHVQFGVTMRPAVEIINGERFFPDTEASSMAMTTTLFLNKKDMEYIKGFDLIHTCVYSNTEQLLEEVKELGIPVIMDMSTEYSELYFRANVPHVDYVILSCSHISVEEMIERMNKTLSYGAKGVLATRGGEGSWYADGTKIYHADAKLVKAVDTQGAGDSFLTAFFSSYLKWIKEGGCVEDDSAREAAVYASLDAASTFTSQTVQLNGAFGHGIPYEEDTNIF